MREFITDEQGQRKRVILDIEEYERLLERAEELDDIRDHEAAMDDIRDGREERTLRRGRGE